MRQIEDEIAGYKGSMNIQQERLVHLMKNERLNATQAEDLMEIAQKLDFMNPKVSDAYAYFSSLRGTKVDRLDSVHEHHLKAIEIMARVGKDTRVYTILMAAYGLCGNAYRANALLRAMKDARTTPTREIFNLLISINGKEGDLEKCTRLFNEMIAFGYEPNAKSWNTLLFLNGRNGDFYECAQLFDQMRTQGLARHKSTYDTLLRIYSKNGLLKTCNKLVSEMENSGVSPDAHTYNLLLDAHAAKGELKQCVELMNTMRAHGVAPDTNTYTSYIQACAKHEKHMDGISAYVRMREEHVPANVLTYRNALACFSGVRAWDACVNLAADMEAQGVEPDARMYQMMLEVCARMGDARVTRVLLDEMKNRNIEIKEETRTTLMAAFNQSEVLLPAERISLEDQMDEEMEGDEVEDLMEHFRLTLREHMDDSEN